MKRFSEKWIGLLLLLPMAGCGTKGAGQGADGLTLRLKPKVGQTYVHEQVQTGPQSSTITSSMKVLAADANSVVIESTFDSATEAQLKGVKMKMTFSPLYQLQSVTPGDSGSMSAGIAKSMGALMKIAPVFPEKAIAVGDKWSMEVDLAPIFSEMSQGMMSTKGDAKMKLDFTLSKLDKQQGKDVAVIAMKAVDKVTVTAMGRDLDIDWSFDGTSAYDIETGMLVSSSMTNKQAIVGGGTNQTQEVKSTNTLKSVK